VIRKVRAASGSRMFEADELRRILDALDGKPVEVDGKDGPLTLSPNPVLRAMTLLAINCAYGQWDVASLPRAAVDLKGGWSTFPRPKTGIPRRAKLWPETVAALQSVMTCRPAPRDEADADLVFLTAKGKRWVRASGGDNPARWKFRTDLIGNDFGKMLDSLGINGRRGFYAIRHSFQTVAEDSRDMPAIKLVMGHADSSMSGIYRERVSDERLEAVAGVVRAWLWPDATKLTDA
jgi:integrase